MSELVAAPAVIRARSERQALDWSLVLASQGIECALEHDEASGFWLLLLATGDEPRARDAIHQYRRENRHFHWQHELPGSDLLFHGGVIFWAVAIALIHAFKPWLEGGKFFYAAAAKGEWWLAFTAVWLHADVAHLASNAVMGALLLGVAMARFGPGLTCLITLFAGGAANLLALTVRQGDAGLNHLAGLGASGMVMGALGMIAAQTLPLWRAGRRGTKLVLTGLGTGALLFILTGTDPSSDVLAHASGFVVGTVLGGLATLLPARGLPWANRISWVIFTALTAGAWLKVLLR